MKVQNPYDKFFKETLGNVANAKDFLIHYLPDNIMEIVDVNTLEPQKDSYINKELEESFSDLLFKVDINEKEGYLYLLFERQRTPTEVNLFSRGLKTPVQVFSSERRVTL